MSSKLILHALANGERDPQAPAGPAKGSLKNKTEQLEQALTGIRFTDHDAFMVRLHLDELDAQITEAFAPFRSHIEILSTTPGVKTAIVQVIIVETGEDMAAFPTSAQLASRAGVAPGNNDSAGRHKPAATTKGNKYLKAALGRAALNVAEQKNGFLPKRYKRIANRRCKLRAIVAPEHTIITAAWNMLANGVCYEEPQPRRYDQANADRTRQHALKELRQFGYEVTLTYVAEPTPFSLMVIGRSY